MTSLDSRCSSPFRGKWEVRLGTEAPVLSLWSPLFPRVKAVAGYASKVTITAPTGTADARRLMALMKLAAKQGMELTVTVDGADEEKAAAELQAFLSANL